MFLFAVPTLAQESSTSLQDLKGDWMGGIQQPTGLKSLMLVDPSRLSISHSLSMSYGSAGMYGSGGSSVTGLFLSHVNYRLADPLHVWMDVGMGFHPGMNAGPGNEPSVIVPGFGLLYQPSEKFRFEVIVQNPNYYYSPYRLWRR
jgi:hypothetical protein